MVSEVKGARLCVNVKATRMNHVAGAGLHAGLARRPVARQTKDQTNNSKLCSPASPQRRVLFAVALKEKHSTLVFLALGQLALLALVRPRKLFGS